MYKYYPGFFSMKGRQPVSEASENTMQVQLYQSWTEFKDVAPTCKGEILKEIGLLPNGTNVFAGTSALDLAVKEIALKARPDLIFQTIRPEDVDLTSLKAWIRENKFKYFLIDVRIAAVLYFCEKKVLAGGAAACIGPFPKIQDVTWVYDSAHKPVHPLEERPRWCVNEAAKTASAFVFAKKNPRFYPNLVLGSMVPFVATLQLGQRGMEYRRDGRIEFDGDILAYILRQAAPSQAEDPRLRKFLELAAGEIIPRPPIANRFYTRVDRYVG